MLGLPQSASQPTTEPSLSLEGERVIPGSSPLLSHPPQRSPRFLGFQARRLPCHPQRGPVPCPSAQTRRGGTARDQGELSTRSVSRWSDAPCSPRAPCPP